MLIAKTLLHQGRFNAAFPRPYLIQFFSQCHLDLTNLSSDSFTLGEKDEGQQISLLKSLRLFFDTLTLPSIVYAIPLQNKMQIVVSSANGYIFRTTPTPKAQGTLQRRGQKDYKKPPSNVKSYNHKVSAT